MCILSIKVPIRKISLETYLMILVYICIYKYMVKGDQTGRNISFVFFIVFN